MLLTVEIQPYCLVKHPKQFLDLRPLQAIKTLILLFHWTLQICVSLHIIESVDSICMDSADTQYMLLQTNFSKSPNS